jgi:hypothetical protein
MSNKSANLFKSKAISQLNFAKKPNTPNSLYSGISSAQRDIQQQRYIDKKISYFDAYIIFDKFLVTLDQHQLGVLLDQDLELQVLFQRNLVMLNLNITHGSWNIVK